MLKCKRQGEEAAAEAADDSEMREAEHPAQESLEPGTYYRTYYRGAPSCPLQNHGPGLQEA